MESKDVEPLTERLEKSETSENKNGEIPESVFEELRKDHSKIGRGRTTTLDVPGYHGNLRVRYKWIQREELTKRGRRLQKNVTDPDTLDILTACDVLVATCDEILVVVGDEERSLGSPPVTFSNSAGLVTHLGMEPVDTAREAVRDIFNNDFALIKTALGVARWLEDTSREVDLEGLGL